jgi:hypothetical protein
VTVNSKHLRRFVFHDISILSPLIICLYLLLFYGIINRTFRILSFSFENVYQKELCKYVIIIYFNRDGNDKKLMDSICQLHRRIRAGHTPAKDIKSAIDELETEIQ